MAPTVSPTPKGMATSCPRVYYPGFIQLEYTANCTKMGLSSITPHVMPFLNWRLL